jgi:hypothetical protein
MKTKQIFAVMIALCASYGCTNLDEKVYSDLDKDLIYTSEQMLMSYSATAYTKLQAYGSEQSLWTLNIQMGDEVAAPRNAYNDWIDPRYRELQTHNITAANKLVYMGWNYCFDGIASCNDVLYEIGQSTVEFAGKQKLTAEIKILRAYFYFLAIDGWGSVPFSIDAADKSYPFQKDRAFVFSFIEQEIKDNIEYLDEAPNAFNYGRITRGVANTILAKMYLNAKEWTGTEMWAEAEAACLAVINPGHYSIADNYRDNFRVRNEGSRENIFVIPYSTTYTTSDHNDFVIYIMTLAPAQSAQFNISTTCWDGFICQPDFFTSYDEADTRRADSWLSGQQYLPGGAKLQMTEMVDGAEVSVDFILDPLMGFDKSAADINAEYSKGAAFFSNPRGKMDGAKVGKWEYQTDGLLTGDQVSMDNDFALFRYADVLYMYAEALLRKNGDASAAIAIPDFEKIRTRAGMAPFTSATLTLDALLAERGHELCLEGWRRQDLIRFGKFSDPWWAKPSASPSHAKLYPIPREARGNNPNLEQNPGYSN